MFMQTPSSLAGTLSPQGQIVVPASALQQGNVTVTAVNPTQVVAGMSPWHTTPPSGTVLLYHICKILSCTSGTLKFRVLFAACSPQLSRLILIVCVCVC